MRINDNVSELYDLVSFGSNKHIPIHRWYGLIEGYGREFVRRIIGELDEFPKTCLDPFGGVGTTALTCQELGIKCHSFEVSPFFYEVARAKLRMDYSSSNFEKLINEFESYLKRCKVKRPYPKLESKTFFEEINKKKWIFNKEVSYGIVDILERIKKIDNTYAGLFRVALGNILVEVSNVYKNGKCLTYRKDWKERTRTRKDVHENFLRICRKVILTDLKTNQKQIPLVHNFLNFEHGDSRKMIDSLKNNSIDLVITSPPYLNSRDYTDIYRLELWILGYISKFNTEQKLRKSALTSHVQIQLEDKPYPKIKEIKNFLQHLDSMNGRLWNKNIPNMVKGYFYDFDLLFKSMKPKLKKGANIFINVSNSAYGGKICEVDKILAKIAVKNGYKFKEIKIARYVNSSKQQHLTEKLRESVIVLTLP